MKKTIIIVNLVLAAILTVSIVYAADTFNLTYRLIEGGETLQLDPSSYKAVELKVESDSTRYEIWQDFVPRIENRNKPGTFLEDNFVMYRLSQGSVNGTFDVQTSPVSAEGVRRIYRSNAAGSLTCTLVYGIDIKNIDKIPAGDYHGKIKYTLKPVGVVRDEVPRYLDVYLTISEEGRVESSIEIIPVTGLNTIYLNSQKEEKKVFDVQVKINRDFEEFTSIYQTLNKQPESTEGNRLNYKAVNYLVSQVSRGGTYTNKITDFSSGKMDIYSSGTNGEVDNDFLITYSLGDLSGEKAGRYGAKIQYYSEQAGKSTLLKTLDLEVENERIFELVITPEEQRSAIEFRGLKPREPPKKSEAILEVKTNIGKAYQVGQNVYSDLTNKEGDIIPAKYFTLITESIDTKGTLKFSSKEEVKKGDTVLFISDAKGSGDKFKIIYELTCPEDLKAGDYSTRITYSLLEI